MTILTVPTQWHDLSLDVIFHSMGRYYLQLTTGACDKSSDTSEKKEG